MITFFTVVFFICSISVIISVLLQEDKQGGMGSLSGDSEGFFGGKGRAKTKDVMLNRIITVSGVGFLVSALALVTL